VGGRAKPSTDLSWVGAGRYDERLEAVEGGYLFMASFNFGRKKKRQKREANGVVGILLGPPRHLCGSAVPFHYSPLFARRGTISAKSNKRGSGEKRRTQEGHVWKSTAFPYSPAYFNLVRKKGRRGEGAIQGGAKRRGAGALVWKKTE